MSRRRVFLAIANVADACGAEILFVSAAPARDHKGAISSRHMAGKVLARRRRGMSEPMGRRRFLTYAGAALPMTAASYRCTAITEFLRAPRRFRSVCRRRHTPCAVTLCPTAHGVCLLLRPRLGRKPRTCREGFRR